jgi:hypothetical protein
MSKPKQCAHCKEGGGVIEPSGYHATCSHHAGDCTSKLCLKSVAERKTSKRAAVHLL